MGEASGRFLGSGSPGRHLPLSLPAASSDSQKPAPAPRAGLTLFSTRETQEHLRHVRVHIHRDLRRAGLSPRTDAAGGWQTHPLGRGGRRQRPTEKQDNSCERSAL